MFLNYFHHHFKSYILHNISKTHQFHLQVMLCILHHCQKTIWYSSS